MQSMLQSTRRAILVALLLSTLFPAPLAASTPAPWTVLLSLSANGVQGDGDSTSPSISANGRYVAFTSSAGNLVPDDSTGRDLFVLDRDTGTLARFPNIEPGELSGDGNYYVFSSSRSDVVPGDTNNVDDIFRLDWKGGQIKRISEGPGGVQANGRSWDPSVSTDGCRIAYTSEATNLMPSARSAADVESAGTGRIAWQVFVYDCATDKTTLVSATPSTPSTPNGQRGNRDSWLPAISGDGNYVTFISEADNLVSLGTLYSNYKNVYVRDLVEKKTEHISVNLQGQMSNCGASRSAISSGGRYVAFSACSSDLVLGDTNEKTDVFVRDRQTQTTRRVSVATDGTQANESSVLLDMSDDGQTILFSSGADNLTSDDLNQKFDLFVHGTARDETRRVSLGSDGREANDASAEGRLSDDGRYVVFSSGAVNLVQGDTNDEMDVFLHDRQGMPQPWQKGQVMLEAGGDGVKVNDQPVPSASTVPVKAGDKVAISPPARSVSLRATCNVLTEWYLISMHRFYRGKEEPNDVVLLLRIMELIDKLCAKQQPLISANHSVISAEPRLQLEVEQGSVELRTQHEDLVLDVDTPTAALKSSGVNTVLAAHDPDSNSSYFGVTAGSATVTPANPAQPPFILKAGQAVEVTDSDIQFQTIALPCYLPFVKR